MTIKATVIVTGNLMKVTSTTVISHLEGSYDNKTHGDSLREFNKANITPGEKPFRGFL
jgi:hypothetical protein